MADAKNTVLFPYETLHKLCMDAFQKFGFSEKEADIIQENNLFPWYFLPH